MKMKAEGEPLRAAGSAMVAGTLQPSQPSPVRVCVPGHSLLHPASEG